MWRPISIDRLKKLTRDLPADLFLRLSEDNYCHVFSRSTGLDYRRLLSYRQKGVIELFYREEDEALVQQHLNDRRMDVLLQSPLIMPEQKAGILLNWTEQTLAEIFSEFPVSEDAAEESRGLVQNLVELMVSQPQSLAALLRLVSHGDYLYYHSVAVSIFSALIARASGKYSQDDIKLISWGGFLHDIGMSRMPKQWTCDPLLELDSARVEDIEAHCRLGMEALQELPSVPREVKFIVYQHHEAPEGRGYPNHLKGSALHAPALIVVAMDAWSALISRHPHREALTPNDAIQRLQSPGVIEQHDPQVVEWLVRVIFPKSTARDSTALRNSA